MAYTFVCYMCKDTILVPDNSGPVEITSASVINALASKDDQDAAPLCEECFEEFATWYAAEKKATS